jgi:hypothetical protein
MEYFRSNYPGPNTIIHSPDWHAPKIYRAALHASGHRELLESLEAIMGGFESGMFVRDVSKDSDPNWSLEMMKLVQMLGKAKAAIAKAKGEA